MQLKQIISSFGPNIKYVPGNVGLDIEMDNGNGSLMVLKREKSLGEEILFKCYEKRTNLFCGFIVRNIKYGFFGDLCDDVKKATDSADQKWFEFMGVVRRTQKQK